MRFYILNKEGHSTLTVEGKKAEKEFDRLIKEGYEALTKEGKKVEKCPDTVEELVFGKPIRYTGARGY